MAYQIKKRYGHELGLSACFRQWGAKSHCRFLHGYPLSFEFTFEADSLDENNWVLNFGGLKPLKRWLEETFDHRLLVAEDDPYKDDLVALGNIREGGALADVLVVPLIGCEAFAKMAWDQAHIIIPELTAQVRTPGAVAHYPRVRLVSVECREHAANCAVYTGPRK